MLCQSDLSPDLSSIDLRRRAAEIKCALKSAGLTLSQVSALTIRRYGKSSPYFLPPTFLHKLIAGVTPHICQIAALSAITRCRFTDWMRAFGFDLPQIPRLQVRLHRERTVLITPVERERRETIAGPYKTGAIADTNHFSGFRSTTPLSPVDELYLYAKIGTSDSSTFPELLPGSIVRVDTRSKGLDGFSDNARSGPIYLVERVGGLTCCRVKQIDNRHILLLSQLSPQSSIPLRMEDEVRILGKIDTELRPAQVAPVLSHSTDSGLTNSSLRQNLHNTSRLCALLQASRERSGLTFRSAHKISILIAQAFHDKHYAISIGLLSDYETMNHPPRHIAKIITLCVVYGIDFYHYLNCAGIPFNDPEISPMPGTSAQQRNPPLTWPTRPKDRTDFPLSLIEAQNEVVRSFPRKRIAV